MAKIALFLSLFSLVLPLARAENTQLTPDEKRILEDSPGVVLIIVSYKAQLAIPRKDAEPQILEFPLTLTGSGFLYRPDGYLITNGHVVADANVKDQQAQEARAQRILEYVIGSVEQKIGRHLKDDEKKFVATHTRASTPQIRVMLSNKSSYVGEIKLYSDPTGVNNGKDVAILKIDANNLPTVQLGNSDDVRVGDALTVIGYPGVASPLAHEVISMESIAVPTFTSGHVSAVKTDYKGTPVLQSDAAITHGNSGGPAFNSKGEVIGIATYGNEKEVAGFNFFVPINTALEFVRQSGATPQSGPFDKTWANALDAYSNGKWDSARGLFADVLELMPNEPDAIRLQTIASQKAREEGVVGRTLEGASGMLWPLAGLALVLAIGITAWMILRSRQPAPVPAGAASVASAAAPSFSPVSPSLPPPGAERDFGSLHVTAGSLNGNRFRIPKAGLLIGRDSVKCQIVISDDAVSKEHAWIVPVDNEVVVIDRGSSNGTYVNSTDTPRVNKVALRHGDRIYIGRKGAAVLTYFAS